MTHDPDWSKDVDGTPVFRGIRSTGTVELGRTTVDGMTIITCTHTWPEGMNQVIRETQMKKIQGPMSRILARVYQQVNKGCQWPLENAHLWPRKVHAFLTADHLPWS